MKLRIFLLIFFVGGALGLAFFIDERWMLSCPLHRMTGWKCPFCGAQRMLQALLHADWQSAFGYNPFLMCSLPLGGLWLARLFFPSMAVWQIPFFYRLTDDRAFSIYLLTALFWGILRNLYICE